MSSTLAPLFFFFKGWKLTCLRFFENNPNVVAFWTRFSDEEIIKGSIEVEPGNKMRFTMIVEEDDFIEALEWFDLESDSDL